MKEKLDKIWNKATHLFQKGNCQRECADLAEKALKIAHVYDHDPLHKADFLRCMADFLNADDRLFKAYDAISESIKIQDKLLENISSDLMWMSASLEIQGKIERKLGLHREAIMSFYNAFLIACRLTHKKQARKMLEECCKSLWCMNN